MSIANRGACRGFSMVELVLALLIAGVLAAVAVPRLLDRSAFQTRGAAAEVKAALRHAQKLAMAKNREVCVGIAPGAVTLSLNPTTTAGAPCSQPVTRPGEGGAYIVALPPGVVLAPAVGFRYDRAGRPSVWTSYTVGGSLPIVVTRETGYVQ